MKVTYQGPAASYSWQSAKGEVIGTIHPGESGDVPDVVLAGSLAQKGVRHVFLKGNGDMLEVKDLKKDAQEVAAEAAAAAPTAARA